MSTARGLGPSLCLALRSQYATASGVEILRDGNMAEVGTAAWTPIVGAPLSKQTTNPYPGTAQVLRVGAVGAYGAARPVVNSTVVGRTYRARGYMRGDGAGVATILITDGGGPVLKTGTNSNLWQWCDVTYVATTTNIDLAVTGASGYVEFAMWSVQEVLQSTDDESSYQDTLAYLGSNRGGAQECLSIVKLEHVDRHTGVVTTAADFSNSPGAGAVYTLPTGWTYSCASGSRTTQTSASTLVTAIAANQAPAKSVTGAAGSFGVGVECQRQNKPFNSGAWDRGSAGWAAGTLVRVGTVAGPDGAPASARNFTGNAGFQYTEYNSLDTDANSCISAWMQLNGSTGGATAWLSSNTSNLVSFANPLWARVSAFAALSQHFLFGYQIGAGTVDMSCYGLQSEVGKYPSSYIPTAGAAVTRSAATLTVPQDDCNTHSGRIPRITIRPHFAYNETALDCTIIDDSRGHLFYEQSTQKFVFEVRGKGRIASLACTFSRDQEIVLRADLDEASLLATLIVSGATTGNGTYQTYFCPRRTVVCANGWDASKFPAQLGPSTNVLKGMSFNGAGTYLDAGRNSPVMGGSAFTLMVGFYGVNTVAFVGSLITKSAGGSAWEWTMRIRATGVLCAEDSASTTFSGTSNVADGQFHVGTVVFNGADSGIYVDGRCELTFTPAAMVQRAANVNIGAYNNGSADKIIGKMNQVLICPFALTQQQIRIESERMRKDFSV